jgi:tetratricopeptide (TPR) repeat protein
MTGTLPARENDPHRPGKNDRHSSGQSLGDLHGALASYRKAQGIRTELVAEGDEDPQLRRDLSSTHLKLATILLYTGDPAGGAEQAGESAVIEESLAASDRTSQQLVRLGRSYSKHGYLLGASGQTGASLERLQRAIALLEPVAATGDIEARTELSTAYGQLGEILEGGEPVPGVVPDIPAALRMHHQALALDEALLGAEPTSARRRRNVVVDHVNIGQVSDRAGDLPATLEHYRLALPIVEGLAAEDPANVQARSDQAFLCQRIGTILAQHGEPEDAVTLLERALRLLDDVSSKDPASLVTRALVANTHTGFGYAQAAFAAETTRPRADRVDRYGEAKEHFRQALAFWTEARERGVTTGEENAFPEKLAGQIADCDRALATLAAVAID